MTDEYIKLAMSKSLRAKKLFKILTSRDFKDLKSEQKLERQLIRECINTLKRQGILVNGNNRE